MPQALFRPRQTGKTESLVKWLKESEAFVLILPSHQMKEDIVKKFFITEDRDKIEKRIIVSLSDIKSLKEKLSGCHIDRIGIDCFWHFDNPKAVLDECRKKVNPDEIVVVFDSGERDAPFNVVDRIY